MVSLVQRLRVDLKPRREVAVSITLADEARDLVEREPVHDAIAQPFDHGLGVTLERLHGIAHQPATAVFEALGQIPVEERDPGRDLAGQECIDQTRIEIEPVRIQGTVAVRDHARPRDREAIVAQAQLAHQVEVGLISVIMVARDLRRMAEFDLARDCRKSVPDRLAFAPLARSPFDLRRRRGHSPDKSRRKLV